MLNTSFTFCEMLMKMGIQPQDVLLMRHKPWQPQLAKVLPWLAIEHPSVYNAYQQTHKKREQKQLHASSFLASFVGNRMGEALFVGLYAMKGAETMPAAKLLRNRAHADLVTFGGDKPTKNTVVFDLRKMEQLSEYHFGQTFTRK